MMLDHSIKVAKGEQNGIMNFAYIIDKTFKYLYKNTHFLVFQIKTIDSFLRKIDIISGILIACLIPNMPTRFSQFFCLSLSGDGVFLE